MNFGRAFVAGVSGGALMTVLMALARIMEMTTIDVELKLGSMLSKDTTATAWVTGLIMHLVISGLIACIYAIGFEYLTHRANLMAGLGFAVIHTIIAGLFLSVLPQIHPLMPSDALPAPGPFAINYGLMTTVVFAAGHLAYGAIVGAMYEVTAEHRGGVPSPA
jgi:hypothetical protein